jgi:putative FmdB family regulatory protein
MPLYEYRCKKCGHQFEKIQSFSAPDEKECPVCKGEVERLISAPAIQFKGSGWYVNDYGSRGGKAAVKSSGASADGKAGASSESKTAAPAASSSAGSPATSKSE